MTAPAKPKLGAVRLRVVRPVVDSKRRLALTIGDTTWFCRDREQATELLHAVADWHKAPRPELPELDGTWASC